MAYSGKYKVKHKSKYKGDVDNIVYRSMWERHCFYWCDHNPNVKHWSSEETVIPYFYDVDKKYHRYFMDLKINFKDGRTLLVEVKPEKETQPPKKSFGKAVDRSKRYISESLTYVKNMNKWEAANEYAKDRGWEFQIWTEKTLMEMGIMPKPSKNEMAPLKPLKPFRRKKTRKKL